MNQELISYIRQRFEQGVSREQIKQELLAAGWPNEQVEEAFASGSPITENSNKSVLFGAGEILGRAWAIYQQRFRTLIGVMIVPIVLIVGFIFILTGGLFSGFFLKLFTGQSGILTILLATLLFIAVFTAYGWSQTALIYAVSSQERIGVKRAYGLGWRKILSFWWISVLTTLILFSGLVLFVIPGIIFFTWFIFSLFVLIVEDTKGLNALLKSREYVRNRWGSALWRLIFITILSLIVSIPVFILSLLKIETASQIANLLLGIFWTPLAMAYLYVMYTNFKSVRGEFLFIPSRGKKAAFGILALLGPLIVAAIMGTMVLRFFLAIRGAGF